MKLIDALLTHNEKLMNDIMNPPQCEHELELTDEDTQALGWLVDLLKQSGREAKRGTMFFRAMAAMDKLRKYVDECHVKLHERDAELDDAHNQIAALQGHITELHKLKDLPPLARKAWGT